MGWELIAAWLISAALAAAFAPKPPEPKAAALADFSVPTADPNRSIPVIFGTVWVNDPNIVWYGHLTTEKIKEDGGWFSGDITVGHKYYLGVHAALSYPVDALKQIKIGDRLAWSGSVANGHLVMDKPGLFGGKKKEGGVSGRVDVMDGNPSQGVNSYLSRVLNTPNIPGFRGVFSLVFRQCYWGNSPYVKNPAFLLTRTDILTDFSTQWLIAKARIGDGLNPAHMVREILTNEDWGMAYPTTQVDDTSLTACANTLYDEGFGLCLKWNMPDSIENFLKVVIDHCSATLDQDMTTGKYTMKLIRDDYTVGSLPVIGPSNSTLTSHERKGFGETVNELVLTYHDLSTDKDTPVTVQDLANIDAQQAVIRETVNMPGIPNYDLAVKVCQNLLKVKSAPLARIELTKIHRTAYSLTRGDVFVYNNPDEAIDNVVYRVVEIDYGDLTSGGITIQAIEDVFTFGAAPYASEQTSQWVSPNTTPVELDYYKIFFPSYYDLARQLSTEELAQLPASFVSPAYMGNLSVGDFYGYTVMVSENNANSYVESVQASSSGHATLNTTMTETTTAINLIDLQHAELVEVDGYLKLLIDNEWMRLDTFDPETGDATVSRSVDVSVPAEHAIGAGVWFSDGLTLDFDYEYQDGGNFDIKLLTETSLGTLDVAAATKIDVGISTVFNLPLPAAHVTINGSYFPAATNTWVTTIGWAGRNRLTQGGELVPDSDPTNYDEEADTSYTVEVYDQTMTLLESASVAAPTRAYNFSNIPHSATELTFVIRTFRGADESIQSQSVTVDSSSLPAFPPNYGDPAFKQFVYPLSLYELVGAGLSDPGTSDFLAAFAVAPGDDAGGTFTPHAANYLGFKHTTNNGPATSQQLIGYSDFCHYGTLDTSNSDPLKSAGATSIRLKPPYSLHLYAGALPTVAEPWIAVLNNEKLLVTEISYNGGYDLTVVRGVLGTIPQLDHADGDEVYLLNSLSIDTTARAVGLAIDQFVLPYDQYAPSTEDQTTAISHTVQSYQTKPYPPHNLRVAGNDIFSPRRNALDSVALTWNHWDRSNTSSVVGYEDTSDDGPESGVSYEINLYDVTGGGSTLHDTVTTGANSTTLDLASAPVSNSPGIYRVTVNAIRSGIYSATLATEFVIGIPTDMVVIGRDHINGKLYGIKSYSDTSFDVLMETSLNSGVMQTVSPTPLMGRNYNESPRNVRPAQFYVGGKWYGYVAPTAGPFSWNTYFGRSVGSDPTDIEAYWNAIQGNLDGIISFNVFYTNGFFWLMGYRPETAGDKFGPLYIYQSTDMQTWTLVNTLVTETYKFIPEYFEWDSTNTRYVLAGDVADEWVEFYGVGTPYFKILYTADFASYTTAATFNPGGAGLRVQAIGSDGAGKVSVNCLRIDGGAREELVLCSNDYLATWQDRTTLFLAHTAATGIPVGQGFVSNGNWINISRGTGINNYGVFGIYTTDQGATWNTVTIAARSAPEVTNAYFLERIFMDDNEDIYVTVRDTEIYDGFYVNVLFRSTDGGVTWTALNDYT